MILFKFECLKWFKNTKNIVIIFLVFITCFILLIKTKQVEANFPATNFKKIETTFQHLSDVKINLANELETMPNNEELNQKLELYDTYLSELNKEYSHLEKNHWDKALKNKINYLIIAQKLKDLGEDDSLFNVSKNIPNEILHNQLFLKNNIKPFPKTGSIQGFYFSKLLLDNCASIFGVLTLILLFFDFFASELETDTHRLLFTQPFKRRTFFNTKLKVTVSISVLLVFLLLCLFTVFWSQLSLSFGKLNYPIAVQGERLSSVKSLNLIYYVMLEFLFFLLITIFVILIIYCLSLFFKNSTIVLVSSLSFLLIPYFFINGLVKSYPTLKLTPFYYFSVSEKIGNAFIHKNLITLITNGILSFLVSYAIIVFAIKKKRYNEV